MDLNFVTVLFVYDSIICTKEALAFGKSLEAMQKLRAELDNLQVQRALLKMNAEDRLQAAKEELLDQIEAKRVQAAALTGMSIEEFREKAGTKFKSIKEKHKKQIPVERHCEDSPLDGLVDQVRHKDRQKSPGDGGAETDITVEIKGLVAVIPVADFEKPLHHISSHVLQSRGTDNAGDIGEDQAVLKRERYP